MYIGLIGFSSDAIHKRWTRHQRCESLHGPGLNKIKERQQRRRRQYKKKDLAVWTNSRQGTVSKTEGYEPGYIGECDNGADREQCVSQEGLDGSLIEYYMSKCCCPIVDWNPRLLDLLRQNPGQTTAADDRHTQTVRPMSTKREKDKKKKNFTWMVNYWASSLWKTAAYIWCGIEQSSYERWENAGLQSTTGAALHFHFCCLSFDEILPPEGTTWNNLPNDLVPSASCPLVMTLDELL